MKSGQMSAFGIDNLGTLTISAVSTVAFEDVVLVAAATALLTAVRRPAWQIYTLVCVPEVPLHAYLGLPAIGMLLLAAGRVWLYRQYGRLLPVMAAHFTFDLVGGCLMLIHGLPFYYRPLLAPPLGVAVSWTGARLAKTAKPVDPDSPSPSTTSDGGTPNSTAHPDAVSIQ
ncbi:hypothetical protein OG496_00855 [Streptomyces sp. NBC_00988]|uniref:hypothetical protein n=1 Tax=Streptomyces sp. NBC_00988 TaxID=2903704 RepID=UPI003866B8B1|nr:hypothetical protein OG496_00855 [Streptomyces sp. NBC_00988]